MKSVNMDNDIKLYLLDYGYTNVDKGIVLTTGKDIGKIVSTPIWGALVKVNGENLLIDTGMNPIHINDEDATFRNTPLSGFIVPKLSENQLAINAIKSLGLLPSDISRVINTHFHFDHCGGNIYFRDAEFYIQKEHFDWAIENKNLCPHRDFLFPNIRWNFLHGDSQIIPGVEVVTTPGHVPGHQSVVITLSNFGVVIIASDAISLLETMDDISSENADNKGQYYESIQKLIKLKNIKNGHIFVSHEQSEWEKWKHAPEWYD